MPELPEVETTKRGVEPYVKNETIKKILVRNNKLRIPFNKNLAKKIINVDIKEIKRRAKYIIFEFVNGYSVVIHLGMTGNLRVSKKIKYLKHDHIVFYLSSGNVLIYNDVRRFGAIDLSRTDRIENHKWLSKLGPEPLSNHFSSPILKDKIEQKKRFIKTAILDQNIVAGIGNIYACEALWEAKISPYKMCNNMNEQNFDDLVNALKIV